MLARITTYVGGALLMMAISPARSTAQLTSGQASDFRVETDIFVQGDAKPVLQTLTLFVSGVAYDLPRDEPNRITMIDPARDRIVLIDSKRKMQTRIDLSELNKLMDSAREQAATTGLGVYIEDAKKIRFDESSNTVTVGDSVLKYVATLQQPREEAMAGLYAQFADTSAYLNAWQSANPPPFARIGLNTFTREKGAIPQEITRTAFVPGKNGKLQQHVLTCRLHANWRLSREDIDQVNALGKMLVDFPVVTVAQFFEQHQVAEAAKASIPSR